MKKPTIRNILVPIDFSRMSIGAIRDAQDVAQQFGASVHLAHVHHQQYPIGFMGPVLAAGEPGVSFEEHREKSISEELAAVARENGLPESTPTHVCEGGSVFHEICRLAGSMPADLIVMPTHGRTGLRHVFLGSTAERVVQHSPSPVLVTRPRKKGTKATATAAVRHGGIILVPVDFSEASFEALEYAIGYAQQTADKLVILNAVHLGDELSNEGLGVYRLADFRQTARWDAGREMAAFLGRARFGDVSYETVIRTGKPADEICNLAEKRAVDLIITGTHGRTGLKHLVMGSVAEQVVRRARQSVLVVPSHPEMRAEGLSRIDDRERVAALTGSEAIYAARFGNGLRKGLAFSSQAKPHPDL
jgi:nucleotide-binding universal stress UspA family protein